MAIMSGLDLGIFEERPAAKRVYVAGDPKSADLRLFSASWYTSVRSMSVELVEGAY